MTEDSGSTRTTLAWGRGHVRHGRVPEWLLDSDASDRAIRLYALLATYADRDGKAFPGKRLLLRRLRCSEPSYRRAAAELETLGALTRTPRSREDGSQTSNDYALHWLPIASQEIGEGVAGDAPPGRGETPPRARDPRSTSEPGKGRDLEETSSPASQATGDGPPKLTKIAGRDLAFDALVEVCGVDPGGNRAREVGIALNGSKRHGLALGIRALAWRDVQEGRAGPRTEPGEEWERWLAGFVQVKARRYLRAMPGAALTPLALAKWWTDLDRPASDPATRAAEEAVRLAEEGR